MWRKANVCISSVKIGFVCLRKSPFSVEGDLLSCAWKKGLLVLSPIKFLLSFQCFKSKGLSVHTHDRFDVELFEIESLEN